MFVFYKIMPHWSKGSCLHCSFSCSTRPPSQGRLTLLKTANIRTLLLHQQLTPFQKRTLQEHYTKKPNIAYVARVTARTLHMRGTQRYT